MSRKKKYPNIIDEEFERLNKEFEELSIWWEKHLEKKKLIDAQKKKELDIKKKGFRHE